MTAAGKARPAGRRFGLVDLLRQAGRMTLRDWRAGELTLVALALVLAVAALTSVGFLADRLRQGLERDARRMLGADFVVRADHPVDPAGGAPRRRPPPPIALRVFPCQPGHPGQTARTSIIFDAPVRSARRVRSLTAPAS